MYERILPLISPRTTITKLAMPMPRISTRNARRQFSGVAPFFFSVKTGRNALCGGGSGSRCLRLGRSPREKVSDLIHEPTVLAFTLTEDRFDFLFAIRVTRSAWLLVTNAFPHRGD
jgi:hypothetical protein